MLPPRRILVAVDFSESARVALGLAARLATQARAELLVLHAQDPLLTEAARVHDIDLASDTTSELDAFVRSVVTTGAVDRLVVIGPAADVVVNIAERENADLLVVGAHGMSGIERVLFGSTAERVLRDSSVPVIVVPSNWVPPDTKAPDLRGTGPLVVGVDLSGNAGAAVRYAAGLATTLGTGIEFVHVVADRLVPSRWTRHAEKVTADEMTRARGTLDHLVAQSPRAAHAAARIETGNVADALVRVAGVGPGRHPWLILGRFTVGGPGGGPGIIARRVLIKSAVPVVISPHTD